MRKPMCVLVLLGLLALMASASSEQSSVDTSSSAPTDPFALAGDRPIAAPVWQDRSYPVWLAAEPVSSQKAEPVVSSLFAGSWSYPTCESVCAFCQEVHQTPCVEVLPNQCVCA